MKDRIEVEVSTVNPETVIAAAHFRAAMTAVRSREAKEVIAEEKEGLLVPMMEGAVALRIAATKDQEETTIANHRGIVGEASTEKEIARAVNEVLE